MQALTCYLRQMLFFHGERRLIQMLYVQILQHMIAGNIAEQRNLIFDALV